MSGVEKIIARLNEETDAQCRETDFAARKKAAEIVARAQAEGNAEIRAAEEAAEKRAAQILTGACRACRKEQAGGRGRDAAVRAGFKAYARGFYR